MDGEASDEAGHEDDEGDAHEEHRPPELGHPLGDRQQGLFVQQQVFQPHQRTLGVHLAALEKDVAVALQIIINNIIILRWSQPVVRRMAVNQNYVTFCFGGSLKS